LSISTAATRFNASCPPRLEVSKDGFLQNTFLVELMGYPSGQHSEQLALKIQADVAEVRKLACRPSHIATHTIMTGRATHDAAVICGGGFPGVRDKDNLSPA